MAGAFLFQIPQLGQTVLPGAGFARFNEDGSKGLPPTLPQAVEQKRASFAVFGGQPGKAFAPVAVNTALIDRDSYDLGFAPGMQNVERCYPVSTRINQW